MIDSDLGGWEVWTAAGGFLLFWVWESSRPFFVQEGRVPHAVRNLAVASLNAIAAVAVFAVMTAMVANFAAARGLGLLHWFRGPEWAGLGVSLLLVDLWTYLWHRANHRFPLLWRFHRMHHSDESMDVTTATRFHLGEIAISSLVRLVPVMLCGIPGKTVLLYELVLLAIAQFHHSNIGLPERIDRLMRYAIVTPNMHRVHHSQTQIETDSNYASVLSIWDRLFRSYRERADYRKIRYGVIGMEGNRFQSIRGMLATPFRSSAVEAE